MEAGEPADELALATVVDGGGNFGVSVELVGFEGQEPEYVEDLIADYPPEPEDALSNRHWRQHEVAEGETPDPFYTELNVRPRFQSVPQDVDNRTRYFLVEVAID
ncbi:MAG: hypothetical protein C0501_14360 [Isosphaera sp.]|nr:hypothetical protein [Isosphaera sp.]